jgi:hypothetical protein
MTGRRWVTLLAGLALTATSLNAAAATPEDAAPRASAAGAKATRLTLAASESEVDHGTTIILSGRLTSGSKGLKGQKVVVKHRVNGTRTWTKVGSVKTRARGAWKKSVLVRLRGTYVAVYKGTRAYAPAKTARRRVDAFAFVTDYAVAPGDRDAYKDEAWTFTARTAPELAGSRAAVVRGRFQPVEVASGTVGPGGAISLTHRMTTVGREEYRISVDGGPRLYGATSLPTVIRTRSEGAPTPPTITTDSMPSVEVHVPYQTTLLSTGGEVTWSAVSALPPGLALSTAGVVTGAPSQVGTWEVVIRASNVAGSATRTLSFTSAPGSLTVTTWPLEDGAVGVDYPEGTFTSFGEQAMSCTPCPGFETWSVTDGALPPGLQMDYDDLLEETYVFGQPTVAGLHSFTVTALADGRSGSKIFTIRVLPSADQLLRIDYNRWNESVPDGVEGQFYSHAFTAGGATGLQWSALSALPPGLSLDVHGTLSGTPTVAGRGWIFVAVTDGTRYDWQGFAMTVAAP